MFKLTKKIEYALIALRYIQNHGNSNAISTKEISEKFSLPTELLAKVLQQLARLEILSAVQGPRGGYKLKRSLTSINLTEFVESMEGPIGLSECSINDICCQMDSCNIRFPMNKINKNMITMFNNITLDELTTP